jgi:ribosomal protein S18 acetylase RimI-like enzyme/DNA-binding CsgD family transcriptional regulator
MFGDGQGARRGGVMAALEERVQRAIRILDRMPKADREVFLLKVIENLSYAAIAAKLEISLETVRLRLASAYEHCAQASDRDEQLETPFTLIYFVNRIRNHFCRTGRRSRAIIAVDSCARHRNGVIAGPTPKPRLPQSMRQLTGFQHVDSRLCRTTSAMLIRPAAADDRDAIWGIIEPVIRAGETYALDRDMSKQEALAYWLAPDKETFVAEGDATVLGTYYMRPNQAGGGKHVCNCGYMTSARAAGRGVARRMCLHSLDHARGRGYRAMQFNFVVSTNERAMRLWKGLGFAVVGRLPAAFNHPTRGYVDALVMHRTLS